MPLIVFFKYKNIEIRWTLLYSNLVSLEYILLFILKQQLLQLKFY